MNPQSMKCFSVSKPFPQNATEVDLAVNTLAVEYGISIARAHNTLVQYLASILINCPIVAILCWKTPFSY